MFKPALPAIAIAALLALAACSDKNDTSVSLSASEAVAASTAAQPASAEQTLTSSDGKISITTANSQFTDQLANAAQWMGADAQSGLVLLQRDDNSGITLSVSNLGAPKKSADVYFKQLAETLKADSTLQDVNTGAATENRMNYRFAHEQDGSTLNENCVAIYETGGLYIACASSDSASQQQLADALKNISLKP